VYLTRYNSNAVTYVLTVVVPDGNGELKKTVVDDPDQTYKKIHHLDPNTTYSFTIAALTDAGPGPEVTVTAFTVPVSGTSLYCVLVTTHRVAWRMLPVASLCL